MSLVSVNVVSKVPAAVWEREVGDHLVSRFLHSRFPLDADVHVIYGIRDALEIPNHRNRIIFVASEPPEIREYNLATLRRYGSVIGADYPYLRSLKNFTPQSGLAPWWLGVDGSTTVHYEAVREKIGPTIAELESFSAAQGEGFTAIVSEKSRTPLQQQRLRLVDYLSRKLPSLRVFGRASAPFSDKAAILKQSAYHLAIENSGHPRYWTEKLSDPILMGNYVFYGGHVSVVNDLPNPGILVIDPWNQETAYRRISEKLNTGISGEDRTGIQENRYLIINKLNFHCGIEHHISSNLSISPEGASHVSIPNQNRHSVTARILRQLREIDVRRLPSPPDP